MAKGWSRLSSTCPANPQQGSQHIARLAAAKGIKLGLPTLVEESAIHQFYLTRALAREMKPLISASSEQNGTLHWYAHQITVLGRPCLVAMEWHSRYAMLFTDLSGDQLQQFPALFCDRLWREVLSICQLDSQRSDKLAGLIDQVGSQLSFRPGHDHSVQAHIKEAAWLLQVLAEQEGSLPLRPEVLFHVGLTSNRNPRRSQHQPAPFIPLEVFRHFWLGMLDFVEQREAARKQEARNNVIPFPRR